MRRSIGILSSVALLVLGLADASAQESGGAAPKVLVKPLVSTTTTATGQPIVLPQKNAEVLVSSYEIPAGATLPVHRHPFPRYAYVLGGTLEVTHVESGKSNIYKAGDFVIEMIGQWHQATNRGAEPVRLLVIDQVEQGAQNTELRK